MSAADDPFDRLREMLVPIRASIECAIYEPEPDPLGSVTGLLTAVPAELCETIGGLWAGISHRVPDAELRRHFTHEDRLLLDLVLSMSDDRRSFVLPAGADRVP